MRGAGRCPAACACVSRDGEDGFDCAEDERRCAGANVLDGNADMDVLTLCDVILPFVPLVVLVLVLASAPALVLGKMLEIASGSAVSATGSESG